MLVAFQCTMAQVGDITANGKETNCNGLHHHIPLVGQHGTTLVEVEVDLVVVECGCGGVAPLA